ncbi:MAG: hypothetical protein KDC92_03230 [Bacteroidetes bacterium]|nr:hypothetical protein [Bacteroidota bacterium]
MRKLIILSAILMMGSTAFGQFRSVNRLAFESNVGFSIAHGDIAPSRIGAALQVGGVYSLLRSMGIGFYVNYASLASRTDTYRRSFESNVIGFQMDYHINIPQLLTDYPQTFPVSPYFRVSVGYDIAQPIDVNFGGYDDIYPETEAVVESSTYTALTIPTVVGAYFRLNQYADLNLKLNYVYANTDMIDGHDPGVLGNRYKDSYSMIMIGVRMKSWDRRRPHITGR